MVIVGHEKDHPARAWALSLAGGPPKPLTPGDPDGITSVGGVRFAPDGDTTSIGTAACSGSCSSSTG
jgi:hypothetical protein